IHTARKNVDITGIRTMVSGEGKGDDPEMQVKAAKQRWILIDRAMTSLLGDKIKRLSPDSNAYKLVK
ncbi:MAG: hypothetical protein UU24_C0011G0001, partial [Candidatus Nomurabacteria bacterium GW2011_GWA2_40_9]